MSIKWLSSPCLAWTAQQ